VVLHRDPMLDCARVPGRGGIVWDELVGVAGSRALRALASVTLAVRSAR
jgi:hypothetical protein